MLNTIKKETTEVKYLNCMTYPPTAIVEELVPVGPLFKELVQPIILTKSDCTLC